MLRYSWLNTFIVVEYMVVVVYLYYSTARVLNIICLKLNVVKTTQKLGLLHSLYIYDSSVHCGNNDDYTCAAFVFMHNLCIVVILIMMITLV